MKSYAPTKTQLRALNRIRVYQDTPESDRRILNCNHRSNFLQGTVKALLSRQLVSVSSDGQLSITDDGRKLVTEESKS